MHEILFKLGGWRSSFVALLFPISPLCHSYNTPICRPPFVRKRSLSPRLQSCAGHVPATPQTVLAMRAVNLCPTQNEEEFGRGAGRPDNPEACC